MLILTRKVKSTIRINGDIVIHVIQTGRSTVKLGIEAPSHVKIIRGELTDYPNHSDLEHSENDAVMLQH